MGMSVAPGRLGSSVPVSQQLRTTQGSHKGEATTCRGVTAGGPGMGAALAGSGARGGCTQAGEQGRVWPRRHTSASGGVRTGYSSVSM